MGYVIARTKVEDVDRFVETFTTRGTELRRKHGSRGSQVFRSVDDPQEVFVVFDWDRDRWEEFLADPEFREVTQAAGLLEPPQPTFVEHVTDVES